MQLKYGHLFWLAVSTVVLFGNPQIQSAEGLTCDICYHRFGGERNEECTPMPCNSIEEQWKAGDVYIKKQNRVEFGAASDEDEATDAVRRRAAQDNLLASRQLLETNTDTDISKPKQEPKLVCVKSVGNKFDKSHSFAFNKLEVYCATDKSRDDSLNLNLLPSPRDEPYTTSDFKAGVGFFARFRGYDSYFCNETNEATCKVTPEDLARPAAPLPPRGDPARGLDCDICYRVGERGSKSCEPMLCNDGNTWGRASEVLDKLAREVNKTGPLSVTSRKADNSKKPMYICAKILASYVTPDSRKVPYTHGLCTSYDPDMLPQADPYKKLPLGVEPTVDGFQLDVDEVYICDENNQDTCQISEEELTRGSPKTTQAPQQATSSSSDTFATSWLLLSSLLLIYLRP